MILIDKQSEIKYDRNKINYFRDTFIRFIFQFTEMDVLSSSHCGTSE